MCAAQGVKTAAALSFRRLSITLPWQPALITANYSEREEREWKRQGGNWRDGDGKRERNQCN